MLRGERYWIGIHAHSQKMVENEGHWSRGVGVRPCSITYPDSKAEAEKRMLQVCELESSAAQSHFVDSTTRVTAGCSLGREPAIGLWRQ